jgi:acetoin utilization protein AcuB
MKTSLKTIMTKRLKTVPMGTSLFIADGLMKQMNIRHLPVVDELDDIVGVLIQRDLSFIKEAEKIPVEYMMTTPVEFLHQDATLREAAILMLDKKLNYLLVADKDENAVGIITTEDILKYLVGQIEMEEPESAEETEVIIRASSLQTIGDVAHRLSLMGI